MAVAPAALQTGYNAQILARYNFDSEMNFYPIKLIVGIVAGFVATAIGNLLPLFLAVIVFEVVDFVTGCIKSAVVARRKKERFAFESTKAWRAIYKVVFLLVGIILAEILDATLALERMRLANYFTGFCCGIEFWSFLENAAVISNHPVFRWLRQFMKIKAEEQVGIDFDSITKRKRAKKQTNYDNRRDYPTD